MRIPTQQYYKLSTNLMNSSYEKLVNEQVDIASGKKIHRASDDPVATERISLLNERISRTEGYSKNSVQAKNILGLHDNNMQQLTAAIIQLKDSQIQSGNGIYSADDREVLSNDVSQILERIKSIANSQDASGNYLYSGSKSSIVPISKVGSSFIYNGDDSQRQLNISDNLKVPISDSGYDIFMDIRNTSGEFTTTTGFTSVSDSDQDYAFRYNGIADHVNTGTKTITSVKVTEANEYVNNIDNYFIQFDTSGVSTTYNVLDSDGQTVVSSETYTDGEPISFNGIEVLFDSTNAPGNNDIFRISPKAKESVFDTVERMLVNLTRPHGSPDEQEIINDENAALLAQLDQIIDHTINKNSEIGSRQKNIEQVEISNEEIIFSATSTISFLEDTDIATASINLNAFTVSLQAAQQSFIKIQNLSLFNFIN